MARRVVVMRRRVARPGGAVPEREAKVQVGTGVAGRASDARTVRDRSAAGSSGAARMVGGRHRPVHDVATTRAAAV